MSHGNFLKAFKEFGIVGTFKKLYKTRTLKFGYLVGVDKYGNQYFENTKDYPHNQHRWVEYAGEKSFYEVDPSNIPAEWHGWVHGVTAEPPTSRTTGSTHRYLPEANAHGSSNPYKRNLGGVITAHTPNLSNFKPRGYGVGNGLTGGSVAGEELFYTQPGYPLDKRNKTVFPRRKLSFSLRDTPLTLKAKEAGRAGVSLEQYDRYLLGGSSSGPAPDSAAAATAGAGAAAQRGTFAAAVHETLSAEEEAFLARDLDEDSLLSTIQAHQRMVDEYSAVPGKDAAAGVARAQAVVTAATQDLKTLRAIADKLQRLADSYDERSVAAAQAAPLA